MLSLFQVQAFPSAELLKTTVRVKLRFRSEAGGRGSCSRLPFLGLFLSLFSKIFGQETVILRAFNLEVSSTCCCNILVKSEFSL